MTTDLDIGRTMISEEWERSEEERKVAKILEEVATEVGAPNIQTGALHGNVVIC